MDDPSSRRGDGPKRRHTVSIRGLPRDLGTDRARLRALVTGTLEAEGAPDGEVSLAFVGDRTMRRINRDYRDIDTTTDVLSFSYLDDAPHAGGVLGEVFVSPAVARRQAEETGCAPEEEVSRLVLHGLLHVLGYDHDSAPARRRMLGRQERYLVRHLGRARPRGRRAARRVTSC